MTRDGDRMGGTPRLAPQARKSTIDIRGLLTNRDYIKTTAYLLPRGARLRVLNLMEDLRRRRRDRRPASGGRRALPDMTGAEMVREINWRVGTLPPHDAEAIARYIHRLTRWRAARRRRGGGERTRTAPPSRPDRGP